MNISLSGEINLRGKTGPLGSLGDGIAKVGAKESRSSTTRFYQSGWSEISQPIPSIHPTGILVQVLQTALNYDKVTQPDPDLDPDFDPDPVHP